MLTELRLWWHELRIDQLRNAIAACEVGMVYALESKDGTTYDSCLRMRDQYRKCQQAHELAWAALATGCLPSHFS